MRIGEQRAAPACVAGRPVSPPPHDCGLFTCSLFAPVLPQIGFPEVPFQCSDAIVAGLEHAAEVIRDFQVSPEDIEYLPGLTGNDNRPLLSAGFLALLSQLKPTFDDDADLNVLLIQLDQPPQRSHFFI